ncbi:MAG: indolepyruvate oxidoreductase subunit beta [Deltaproteobacteria bacterium]|nr:indolepyruvate oxidoreductase subunit beta [Deltaproteobacteria bacterium]MBW1952891.1 indolepyruvate oxidoreductase subunit beta [Deltaproteobacteria bacterium]MBW1987125.1 indolepyruvate oxidoreductase subunit beta [Deltaproteobacteria bacterium]MBW2135337.1 indolepyruvate oxidoreductase subunit beta [Deltaproteobacteria bacterium]
MDKSIKLRIFCTGVGGQGTLLASRVLGEAAMTAGYSVLVSETHGMAQRGGVVESAVIIGALASPIISPGEADIVLSFEALEAFRALSRCHPQTLVITNTNTIIPQPVAIGQAHYPPVDYLLNLLAQQVGDLFAFDAESLAQRAGNPRAVNMVLLGALARSGRLPFPKEVFVQTIADRTPAKYVETNMQTFRLGQEAAARQSKAP